MIKSLLAIQLQSDLFLTILYSLSAVTIIVLATKRPFRKWLPIQLLGALVGVIAGYLLAWMISDVWNTFGVSLSPVTRTWFGVGVGGIGFAVAGLVRSRAWRAVLATTSIFLFALTGAIGVNADIAEFPTLGSAIGVDPIHKLALPVTLETPVTSPTSTVIRTIAETWHAPAGMPKSGTVGTVIIPATVSHFPARPGIVYLPPAALVKNAPRLPVLVMLSGQPGMPMNLFTSGALATILNQYSAAHQGLAPIVVVPDQLGAPQLNPMCVDSPLGNSATYLTTDVPNWINSHLHVLGDSAHWGIGGFSEGGTCSIQLGTKYSKIFGSILDISGQLAPHNGSIPATINKAFGGSVARFTAASPLALLSAGAPFTQSLGIFVVGQNDTRFGPAAVEVSAAAKAAGMTVHYFQSPGTAHDWHTVQYGIEQALPLLYAKWGLS